MSDGLQLSSELMNDLFNALAKHDKAVEEDLMVGLQYLSAVIGYFSAEYPGTDEDRYELLDQLAAFTVQVADDRASSIKQQATQQQAAKPNVAAGRSTLTDNPAVGVWKPE